MNAVNRICRYLYVFNPLASAITTRLYSVTIAVAAFGLPASSQFIPTVNGHILFSARLLDISQTWFGNVASALFKSLGPCGLKEANQYLSHKI